MMERKEELKNNRRKKERKKERKKINFNFFLYININQERGKEIEIGTDNGNRQGKMKKKGI